MCVGVDSDNTVADVVAVAAVAAVAVVAAAAAMTAAAAVAVVATARCCTRLHVMIIIAIRKPNNL